MRNREYIIVVLVGCLIFIEGCLHTTTASISKEGTMVVVHDISEKTLRFYLKHRGEIDVVVLEDVEGSSDDESVLELGRLIYDDRVDTQVVGFAYSGGVDLFLAGENRSIRAGSELGVHSWAADGLFIETIEGAELPRNHEEHTPYLDYYDYIGIDSEFYWYTLRSARADDIHIMTTAEIQKYRVVTD